MRRLPLLAALAIACAVSVLVALALPRGADARPNVAYGIEQFGNMENPALTPMLQDTMRGDGARVMRYVVRWDWVAVACNPRTRGDASNYTNPCYSWGFLDAIVIQAQAR